MDMMSLRRRVLVNQNKLVSATGNPLTFNTPLTKPLKECVVRFTPQQEGEGTPSPDNVMPISGWNGMTVTRCGKNLLDPENNPIWNYSSSYVINGDGTITIKSSDSRGWTSSQIMPFPLKKGTYTFNWTGSQRVQFTTSADNYQTVAVYTKSFTFTLQEDGYIKWKHTSATSDYPLTITVQIEKGETATDYEPYEAVEIPISFPQAIYGGYVDLVSGELVGEYEYFLLNSGDNISSYTEYDDINRVVIGVARMPSKAKPNSTSTLRCNYFKSTTGRIEWGAFIGSTSNLLLYVPKSFTSEDFGVYLQENSIQVCYERETPVRYQLTPTQIKALKGINNIWSDANGDITVRYWTR